jgi:hypothetical protein
VRKKRFPFFLAILTGGRRALSERASGCGRVGHRLGRQQTVRWQQSAIDVTVSSSFGGTVCTMCPTWSVVQSLFGPSVDTCGVRSKSLSKSLDGMNRHDAMGSSCATVEGSSSSNRSHGVLAHAESGISIPSRGTVPSRHTSLI